jgi:hypothetical protein
MAVLALKARAALTYRFKIIEQFWQYGLFQVDSALSLKIT